MLDVHLLVAAAESFALGGLQGFLSFLGEAIDIHTVLLPLLCNLPATD